MSTDRLTALKRHSIIVADSGEIDAIRRPSAPRTAPPIRA